MRAGVVSFAVCYQYGKRLQNTRENSGDRVLSGRDRALSGGKRALRYHFKSRRIVLARRLLTITSVPLDIFRSQRLLLSAETVRM